MKKISVIIPCYNAARWIDRCMTSIMAQTIGIGSLEIICIDDASTDDTWEHLQKWERQFSNDIVLIRQEVNRRQGAARNLGLQYATTEWIAFVDADDWLEPVYFERLYGPTTRYSLDVVSCGFIRDAADSYVISDRGSGRQGKEQYIAEDTEDVKRLLFRYKSLGPGAWAKIIRKNLLIENGISFPEGVVYEDHYWVPLLHVYAVNVYIIEEELYHYFWNPHSTVLSRAQEHHLDQLTVQMMKWKDYRERGLLSDYRQEIEYDLIWYAVTSFMKTIILFWDEPPYPYFRLGQEIMKQQVPDHEENPYIEDLSEVNRMLLDLLYSTVDKEGFRQISRQIKMLLGGQQMEEE